MTSGLEARFSFAQQPARNLSCCQSFDSRLFSRFLSCETSNVSRKFPPLLVWFKRGFFTRTFCFEEPRLTQPRCSLGASRGGSPARARDRISGISSQCSTRKLRELFIMRGISTSPESSTNAKQRFAYAELSLRISHVKLIFI